MTSQATPPSASAGIRQTLALGFPGFSGSDLYGPAHLSVLADVFHEYLRSHDPSLWQRTLQTGAPEWVAPASVPPGDDSAIDYHTEAHRRADGGPGG